MKKPITYNISPAKGQALLNFEGRRYPEAVELFETQLIEEVRPTKEAKLFKKDKQADMNPDFRNLLIHGDCLSACAYLISKNIKVDLVYIDPPFASGANYAKKIYLRNGGKENLDNDDNAIGEEIVYGDIWQKEDYLNWLYERLLAIKEVMSETGSIYVHLDWHIGHYVKLLLDEIFGENNFKREIIWTLKGIAGYKSLVNSYVRGHDSIFYYSKNEELIFHKQYLPYNEKQLKRFSTDETGRKYKSITKEKVIYLDEAKGVPLSDVWNDIASFQTIVNSPEIQDYNTQKPEALVERIIKASSDDNMIIADFFSGSGTTAKVSNYFNRKFIACDIGINAIQTSRDRLLEANAEFDILKINDGVRLFRNPAQTTAKIFSLIDGFKNKSELDLGDFWDGGIINKKGNYTPVKFIGIHEKLSKELIDVILEQVYQIDDEVEGVKIIYAHKDFEVSQNYINKEINKVGKTDLRVELISLDELLGQKADVLFTPDTAEISIKKDGSKFKVEIENYFSSYLKNKIDDFNAKKVKKSNQGTLEETVKEELEPKEKFKPIKISDKGLELIESVQFDTTLRKDNVWISNPDLEDKAKIKEKIKGKYTLTTNKFKIKIRNIAGDEIIIDSSDLK